METDRRKVALTPARICSSGGGIERDEYLHLQTPEYSRAVHCDANYYQTFFGGVAEAVITGPQAVVGAGGFVFCGPVGGSREDRYRYKSREGI